MGKIIMSWNLNKEDESNYFEFIVQEFLPEMMKLGLRPTQAWFNLYGPGPQIISTAEPLDADLTGSDLRAIVASDDWSALMEKLSRFVSGRSVRVAR